MKILSVTSLYFPEVKVIRYGRFRDHRGYFTEQFRRSDFRKGEHTPFLRDVEFLQCNESFSSAGTIRGLHFQWNPYMGKLIRTVQGHMIDLILDIRKGSPTFGHIMAYDMPTRREDDYNEWIWVPPGFAHGNTFLVDSAIEYFCSGEYSPGCEAGISPLAPDLNWQHCDTKLRDAFATNAKRPLISDKDRDAPPLTAWVKDARSDHFVYGKVG